MREEEEEILLVAISIIKDEYSIKYNPFVPDKILIDALETALKGLKEGGAEIKVDVNVEIGG